MQNNKNLLLATFISMSILLAWTWFYEKPRIEKQEELRRQEMALNAKNSEVVIKAEGAETSANSEATKPNAAQNQQSNQESKISSIKDRKEILAQTQEQRISVKSDSLHGSISLVGARFDDLTLAKYFTSTKKDEEVILFAPSNSKERYFADFGWVSSDKNLQLPNPQTVWRADVKELTPQQPLTLTWQNAQNIQFIIKITLDENYMFGVTQAVKNNSKAEISLASYGRVNRSLEQVQKSTYISHEGAIGVFSDVLHEVNYEDLAEEKRQEFADSKGGWLGISDKYWLSSILPQKDLKYSASFDYEFANKSNFFNSEFVAQEFKVAPQEELKFEHHLFAGAKKVALLDQYAKDFNVKLFDRAIDFGWFYFLTKPFFYLIEFFSKFLGNFGLAILAVTVLVKLALFPMANKSYGAIARIKKLQPKIEELRKKFKDDRMAMNREMMELYKREKVNPASGCLPILIQIPIFFSLYKVFYVTLDMRHAPFYGWIKDLSAPDPTSIFNLFGLLPYEVSPAFMIGVWPILMGLTMIIQQKLSPMTSDPTQAKILKWMPYGLTFVLAAFPAGLVIYWTWSNALSILQQWILTKKINAEGRK